jgi:hypothetical protein
MHGAALKVIPANAGMTFLKHIMLILSQPHVL